MALGNKKNVLMCNKHSPREAKEVCVRCKAALCDDCRLKDKEQAFCSSRCYRLYLIKRSNFHSVKPFRLLETFRKHSPISDAFAIMITLILVAAIHFKPPTTHKGNIIVADLNKQTFIDTAEVKKATVPVKKPAEKKPAQPEKIESPKKAQDRKAKKPKKKYRRPVKTSSIYKVQAAGKKLSITFDGGSNDSAAREILDVLKNRGINTTFFLTANFIRSYPNIVKRMVAEGHEVGNHTFSHPHLTTYDKNRKHKTLPGVNSDFIKKELDSTAKIFTRLTGKQMAPYWRAPYGEFNKDILRWAAGAGYRHISWTVDWGTMESMDSLDWVADQSSSLYLSSDEIKARLLAFADNKERARGGIVLMHLGTERKVDKVHEKLEDIIDSFLARGYEVVPVSTLLKAVKKG